MKKLIITCFASFLVFFALVLLIALFFAGGSLSERVQIAFITMTTIGYGDTGSIPRVAMVACSLLGSLAGFVLWGGGVFIIVYGI